MESCSFDGVIELQRLAFPPPFPQELLWQREHLQAHVDKFPLGQFVAIDQGKIVGSCSTTIISQERYDRHLSWEDTVGGFYLDTFNEDGEVMYGLDISVHPDYRNQGMGRGFYEQRFFYLSILGNLKMYATTCRLPDFRASGYRNVRQYCEDVKFGQRADRTLTPLLRYGLFLADVLENHMDDPESGNAAALLEYKP